MNNAWEVYFQRKVDFSRGIQILDITRFKLSTQSMLLLVPKKFDCSNMGESALKSHMRGRRHKELAALTAERSAPITQFMSSNAASSSRSDKPGPLTSHHLDSSPSVHDASAETPSSSASLKEMLVLSYMAKEETLRAEIRWTLHTVEKHHSFHSNEAIDKVFQDMFGDSAIAKKFSCREKKCSYIACFGLAPYFGKLLKEKVDMEDSFVLLFDESLNFFTKNK